VTIPAKVALKELATGKPLVKPTNKHEMLELSRRLIGRKTKQVIDEILRIALTADHPEQMSALKILAARIAPQSFYEKMADRAQAGNQVSIQINVVGREEPKDVNDIVDNVIVEVKDGQ
jgi:hypothetical protein